MRRNSRVNLTKVMVLVMSFLLSAPGNSFSQNLKIHTIHVHGDAHLIQTPGGKTMLIDAGSPWHVDIIKDFIDSLGISSIDIAFLTHFHGDHVGGYTGEEGILAAYHVSEFYGVEAGPSIALFQKGMLPFSKNPNLEYQVIKRGDFIDLDPDIEIKVLYPPDPLPDGGLNNGSAACMIKDLRNGKKFLYMGDGLEKQARELVAFDQEELQCDVLKYGHHLQYESDDDFSLGGFLEVTKPKYGIITKHKMSKPGPVYHELTTKSLRKLYDYTWRSQSGLKSFFLAKHGHITVTCTEDGEVILTCSENNEFIPPEITASEKSEINNGVVTLKLTLSEPTWDHYPEEIRGCYSLDGGQTWDDFFYPDKQLELNRTTTVMYEARDIYGNSSMTKSVNIILPASRPE